MRKIALTLTAASALALGACQSPAADSVEDKANAMDDNGEVAPSETGVGDTQKK
jgi:hypothetical protein